MHHFASQHLFAGWALYQSTPVAWYTATKTSETGIYSPPASVYQQGPSWIRWAGLGVSKLPSCSGFAPRASQLPWIQGLTEGVLLWNAEHTSLHKPTSTPALQRTYFYLMAKGNQLAKTEVDNIFILGRTKYFLVYSNQPRALRQKYWFGKSSRLRLRSPEFWSRSAVNDLCDLGHITDPSWISQAYLGFDLRSCGLRKQICAPQISNLF